MLVEIKVCVTLTVKLIGEKWNQQAVRRPVDFNT